MDLQKNQRTLLIFLSLTVMAAQAGCARVGPARLPDPPSEELRSTFGRVGVTWKTSGDSLRGRIPARGSCDGAGRGAVVGLVLDLEVTGALVSASIVTGPGFIFLGSAFLALGLGLTPVYALIGSLYGAAAAPDAAVVEKATATMQRAIDEREFSRGVAEAILDRARVAVDDRLEKLPDGSNSEGYDTILEVAPPLLVLEGAYTVNPELRLSLLESATLTRVSDRRVLYQATLLHRFREKADFLGWASNDAALMRTALVGADHSLGDRLLDEIFLLHALPSNREWSKVKP
jgi:hypothetical protein